jgi:hypothetical protein
MAHRVTRSTSSARLERLLEALGEELIESTDEELLEAARELGMDLRMRWSSAFAGINYPATIRAEDFIRSPLIRPEALRFVRNSKRLESHSKPGGRKRRAKGSGLGGKGG